MKTRETLKLLVVEDDRDLCRIMVRDGYELGYAIECTHSLAQTRVTIRSSRDSFPYAIVLLDLKLEDGDSNELVRELLAVQPAPLVVVISSYLTARDVLELNELGVALCLPKPVGMHDIAHRLANLKSRPELNARSAAPIHWRLSHREEQVLECGRTGLSRKETAARLGISTHSVRTYWNRILDKTGFDSERRAVAVTGDGSSTPRVPLDEARASAMKEPSTEPSVEMDARRNSGIHRARDGRRLSFGGEYKKLNVR